MLFLGTMFAPVQDRDAPGQGFTHHAGDVVTIAAPGLGALVNPVGLATEVPEWTLRRRRADAQPRRAGAAVSGRVRVGVGGWVFEPWRGSFYPEGLAQKRELEYASRKLTTIEINGTYYGSQKPESFARWHDETPDDFVFAVKGPRFATNRRVLAEAGESVERFFGTGRHGARRQARAGELAVHGDKKFDLDDFAAFLALLPKSVDGRPIRHAVEVRHASFPTPEFVALARDHGVARGRRRSGRTTRRSPTSPRPSSTPG